MKNSLINSLLSGAPLSPLQKFQLCCEPVTIGMGVMAAGAAATQIMAQQQASKGAKSVEEARRLEQENVIAETRRRATDDYLTQSRLEKEQQAEEEAAVSIRLNDTMREVNRTEATGEASAAERGVTGRSVDMIAADYDFQANEEIGRLKENQRLTNQQHQERLKGFGTEYTNRVTDARPYIPRPVAPVDYFGPIFGAGQQALSTDVAVTKASPTAKTFTNFLSGK